MVIPNPNPSPRSSTASAPLRTADFDYPLPESLIAQAPSARRGESRLLHVDRAAAPGVVVDRTFDALPTLLAPGDLLIINTTRVRHARLLGRRPSGAPAEVLLIHPAADDTWVAIGKPGSAMRPGKVIDLGDGLGVETVAVLEGGERTVRFIGGTAEDAMQRFGMIPLPPYIQRAPTALDDERYQTVYAERAGSVAAPTAGLHFTESLLRRLAEAGVVTATVDLEVGPGTFKPVEEEDPGSHHMHPEDFEVPDRTVREVAEARARGSRVWAVGTTVVRALESAADETGQLEAGRHTTSLMISPGYRFRVVDALVTNFHLPRSTLLMLVCAFAGFARTMAAYRHAVDRRYRFYSYGDAMVIT